MTTELLTHFKDTSTVASSVGASLVDHDPLAIFIPLRIVERMTGKKRSSIYEAISRGSFPAPVQHGEMRASGRVSRAMWVKSEIEFWIAAKIAAPRSTH